MFIAKSSIFSPDRRSNADVFDLLVKIFLVDVKNLAKIKPTGNKLDIKK